MTQLVVRLPVLPAMREHAAAASSACLATFAAPAALPDKLAAKLLIVATELATVALALRARRRIRIAAAQ